MLPSARPPLLLSSILGGIALCLFVCSLKTPAAVSSSAPPVVVRETRTAGAQRVASRRLQGGHGHGDGRGHGHGDDAPPFRRPKSPQTSERHNPRNTGVVPVRTPEGKTKAEARSVAVTAPAASGGSGGSGGCWIFMHLQKCGGSTVKKMLQDRWGSRYFVYDSMRWKFGDEFSRGFGEKLARGDDWNVMAGGYPEALRRTAAVDASCRFFTVFRHPISRLVSAYFYCQILEDDVACASNIVRARDVDLLTFAKHWSNFAVRQFALSMVPADDVMAYIGTPEVRALLPESIENVDDVAGWYLLKMYLERPEAEDRGAPSGQHQPQWETIAIEETAARGQRDSPAEEEEEEVPDAQMLDFLQPARALLSDGYAAVGILESWNTTLSLFDRALDMPEMEWRLNFQEEDRQNVDPWFQKLRAETLEKAWTDPELHKYLQLDLLLYEHAVDVFRHQAHSHGLQ